MTIDLGGDRTVRAIQVNYVDYRSKIFESDSSVYTQFRMLYSQDGKRWEVMADLTGERRDRPTAYVELPRPVRARYVRYEHGHVASANLAIGDIRIFGNDDGRSPATPAGFTVRRDADSRNAFVSWKSVRGAVGYNILWGIGPKKLYQTYQVFADRPRPLEIRALTVGQEYWFSIEAFDESGVSKLSQPVYVR